MGKRRNVNAGSGTVVTVPVLLAVLVASGCDDGVRPGGGDRPLDPELVAEGREIFRHDTFGDEVYWTDTRPHGAAEGRPGGVSEIAVSGAGGAQQRRRPHPPFTTVWRAG